MEHASAVHIYGNLLAGASTTNTSLAPTHNSARLADRYQLSASMTPVRDQSHRTLARQMSGDVVSAILASTDGILETGDLSAEFYRTDESNREIEAIDTVFDALDSSSWLADP